MKEIYESVQQYILENPEYKTLREEDKLWLDEIHTELGVRLNNNIIRTITNLPCKTLLGRVGLLESGTIVYDNVWSKPTKEITFSWGSSAVNRVTISNLRLDEVESKLKLLEDWVESLSNKICSSEKHSGITVYEYFNNLNK